MTNVNQEIEIWKDIPGYEGRYLASNIGNIKSIISGKFLKQHNLSGYLFCYFRNSKGVKKSMFVHRAVLSSFECNTQNLPQINHKNAIKTDNRLENLEWCTVSYNMLETFKNPLRKKPKHMVGKYGKLHHNSRAIIQKDINGNIVKKWDCLHDAMKSGFAAHKALKTGIKCKGYFWEYDNEA